jgi:hypothetical protein
MALARELSGAHHEPLSTESAFKVSSDRTFGLVFCVVFAAIALLPLRHGGSIRWWAFALSGALFAIALAIPRVLHPFNVIWARLALLLHYAISPVAMALLFFFGFAITGIVLRTFGKDLLRLKRAPGQDTYWIPREMPGPTPESMTQQF